MNKLSSSSRNRIVISTIIILLAFVAVNFAKMTLFSGQIFGHLFQKNDQKAVTLSPAIQPGSSKVLRNIGQANLDHFGLSDNDFKQFQQAKVEVIEGNFDICASNQDLEFFLAESQKYQLKVILPAGSGEAEWGYACNGEPFPKDQPPIWNKTAVLDFVNKWKGSPAIFGWDISDEAGASLPNADLTTYANMLSSTQLRQSYSDIKNLDSQHQIIIHQNGLFYYKNNGNFFREGNPFAKNLADVVIINARNEDIKNHPDFVQVVKSKATQAIHTVDPQTQVILSIGN